MLVRNGQLCKTVDSFGKKQPLWKLDLLEGRSWYAPADRYTPEMFTHMLHGLEWCRGPLKDALYEFTLRQLRESEPKRQRPLKRPQPQVKVIERKRPQRAKGLEPFRTASKQVCGSSRDIAFENCPACSGENTVGVEFVDGAVAYKCHQCDFEFVETV